MIDEEGSCEVGRQMPMTTSNSKYAVGEIHRDSNPMAERSATVTRRVQPARGKGFCEAETSNADNDVKPEALRRRGQRGLKSDGREVCNRHEKKSDASLSRRREAIVPPSAGNKSGALFTPLALVTKYVVKEIHRDSDPMAERSATVTRRVQPTRGKGFCEAETLMPTTTPNLKIGCLVVEGLRRDFVEAIEGNSVDVRWSQIRGAVHSFCLGRAQRRWAERSAVLDRDSFSQRCKAMENNSGGVRWSQSGALFTPVYRCVSTYPCIAVSMHPCIPVSLSCE